jgi:mannose-6-phosphate isomerase-like protein (cupin superfamily)
MIFPFPVTLTDALAPDWKKALSEAVFDPIEGVRLAILMDNAACRLCIASLAPCAKIPAHVHAKGQELYYILQGKCRILTGEMCGEAVKPLFSMPIKQGESFGIPECMAHEIQNTGTEDLVFLLVSPQEHFSVDRKKIASISSPEPDPFFSSYSS